MKIFEGNMHGIGLGVWLTNFKHPRFSIVDDWDRKPLNEELIKIIF